MYIVKTSIFLFFSSLFFLADFSNLVAQQSCVEADQQRVFRANFNTTTVGQEPGNQTNLVKSNFTIQTDPISGITGASVPSDAAVSIYNTPSGFDPNSGAIQISIKLSDNYEQIERRQHLWHLAGMNSLNGSSEPILIVGEDGVESNWGVGKIYAPLNPEPGLFQTGFFQSQTPRFIGSGHFNSDHIPDLMINHVAANQIRIYNGPINLFPWPSQVINLEWPQGGASGDLDNDGDTDICAASFYHKTPLFECYENDGNGRFSKIPLWENFPREYKRWEGGETIDLADLNCDGVLDIVVGSLTFTDRAGPILLGGISPDGSYYISDQHVLRHDEMALSARLADFNNDGWIDLATAQQFGPIDDDGFNAEEGVIRVRFNDRSCTPPFFNQTIEFEAFGPFTMTEGDINNDGYLDLMVANSDTSSASTSDSATAYLGPDFSSSLSYAGNNPVSTTSGDLNGDGIPDLFLRNQFGDSSPLYYLDINGMATGMIDVPTRPTEIGMGVYTGQGPSSYGRNLNNANSFLLYLEGSELNFVVTDNKNKAHHVSAELPANSPNNLFGIIASWNSAANKLSLSISSQNAPTQEVVYNAPDDFTVGTVEKLMRFTNSNNQHAASNSIFDYIAIFAGAGDESISCKKRSRRLSRLPR